MTTSVSYTKTDWDADFMAVFAQRSPPTPCPGCHRTGFFGPRKAHDRLYRLCKFCGFYQLAGGRSVQCVATVHGCSQWPQVAGAAYVWWVQPDESQYTCPSCGSSVQVAPVVVKRPVEDPAHPWWQVPQNMSFEEAASFWVQHGQGRVYL